MIARAYAEGWWRELERVTRKKLLDIIISARDEGWSVARTVEAVGDLMGRARAKRVAVTECLPPETFVDGAVVKAAFRRWYEGQLIEIRTSGGRYFAATPNHPVLTSRGWIAAGEIAEGDDLICYIIDQATRGTRDPHVERPPATLGKIFDTLSTVAIPERITGTEPDFHGDGRQGEVDVFSPFGPLGFGVFTPISKPSLQNILAPSDRTRARFCHSCHTLLPLSQTHRIRERPQIDSRLKKPTLHQGSTGAEIVRDTDNRSALLITSEDRRGRDVTAVPGRLFAHPIASYFTSGANDVRPSEDSVNPIFTGTQHRCDFSTRHSVEIERDHVVRINRRPYRGHVFNLSTPFGYFSIGGGVVSGNTTRLFGAGQQETFRQLGITGWWWRTAEDERVESACRAMSQGGPYPIEQDFVPQHIGCRCWMAPITTDEQAALA
jgi:hypothetical protein